MTVTHSTTATGSPLIDAADWNAGHTVTGLAATTHTHSGSDIDSGTVADARIASTIARDSEITATKLDDFATPDDNTDLNVSTSRHGLAPKLSNVSTEYLSGTGVYSTPSGSGSSPRTISVIGVAAASATTGTWTPSVDAASPLGGYSISSSAQNDAITWPFSCDAGTYTLTLQHSKGNSRGIYTVKIDGVSAGTIDGYNGTSTNNIDNLTGIAITAGAHTIQFVMATKNGSSSLYYGIINGWSLTRTGA